MAEQIIEIRERIARIEEKTDALKSALEGECRDRERRDDVIGRSLSRLEAKIDHILENDKDKLQRIAILETKNRTGWKIIRTMVGSGGLIGLILALVALLV